MRISIIYESKYGNGKICVEYLKNAFSKKGHDAQTFSVIDIKPDSLPKADLYIFSAPTHVGGPPRKIKKFLKKLKIDQDGLKYALMVTHMAPEIEINTMDVMEDTLQSKGFKKINDGIRIKVNGIKGPLDIGYEKKIDEFVNNLLK